MKIKLFLLALCGLSTLSAAETFEQTIGTLSDFEQKMDSLVTLTNMLYPDPSNKERQAGTALCFLVDNYGNNNPPNDRQKRALTSCGLLLPGGTVDPEALKAVQEKRLFYLADVGGYFFSQRDPLARKVNIGTT